MAKIDLKFLDFIYDENCIKVEKNTTEYGEYGNNYTIDTIDISIDFEGNCYSIHLDKSTAIKFAKTLRTEINKIQDEKGGLNG